MAAESLTLKEAYTPVNSCLTGPKERPGKTEGQQSYPLHTLVLTYFGLDCTPNPLPAIFLFSID